MYTKLVPEQTLEELEAKISVSGNLLLLFNAPPLCPLYSYIMKTVDPITVKITNIYWALTVCKELFWEFYVH